MVDLWKAKTQKGGGKSSQDALVAAFLEELRRLPGTENVIKQIKSECIPAMHERLTKRLAKEIFESGIQGRGKFNQIFLLVHSLLFVLYPSYGHTHPCVSVCTRCVGHTGALRLLVLHILHYLS